LAAGVGFLATTAVQAQLRVATWNISNYTGGRDADIKTAVYSVFEDRAMAPDIILCQEFSNASSAAVTAFKNILNSAPGSPGDWQAAPWVYGPDTVSAFFYRTSKATYLGYTVVINGGNDPAPPRNVMRYDVRLMGYTSVPAVLCCYDTHMKAGTTSSDRARRLVEAQAIRDNAENLDPQRNFLLGGDFNIRASTETAYGELVDSQANNQGRFFDPINTPENWHQNSWLKFTHTQDPSLSPGMDDRYDQLLVSGNLIDGNGLDYIGNPIIPYSTSTWNDANHSYRAWGNDGTSYGQLLTITGNTMVGAAIAQAIVNAATTAGGHIPVFLDLRVPAVVGSDPNTINFGSVPQNSVAEQTLSVWNAGNVALWSAAGIDTLRYTLTTTPGFTAPPETFDDVAGGGSNAHVITMDTSAQGPSSGTLTIASNAPDAPARIITLLGEVTAPAWPKGDMNCDGWVDSADINPFVLALTGYDAYHAAFPDCNWLRGDCNDDGFVDFDDINTFVDLLQG
jgi:endonuclease/exonuclease/phosphatase family metal-dependent hydrolase